MFENMEEICIKKLVFYYKFNANFKGYNANTLCSTCIILLIFAYH